MSNTAQESAVIIGCRLSIAAYGSFSEYRNGTLETGAH